MNDEPTFGTLAKFNPIVARLVAGGGLVLFMAAVVIDRLSGSWYSDKESIPTAVGGLLATSMLVALLAALAPTRADLKPLRFVFSWFITALFLMYCGALFLSVVTAPPWPQPFPCLIKPWQPCDSRLHAAADRVSNPPPSSPGSPAVPPISRAAYTVTLQFVGFDRTKQTKPLTAALKELGWNVPRWEAGGDSSREVSKEAVGTSEVRYQSPDQRAAAEVLAADIFTKLRPTKPVIAKMNSTIKKNELEIWISP
jgi:hypothetical protein